jgi:hypothetical protein
MTVRVPSDIFGDDKDVSLCSTTWALRRDTRAIHLGETDTESVRLGGSASTMESFGRVSSLQDVTKPFDRARNAIGTLKTQSEWLWVVEIVNAA